MFTVKEGTMFCCHNQATSKMLWSRTQREMTTIDCWRNITYCPPIPEENLRIKSYKNGSTCYTSAKSAMICQSYEYMSVTTRHKHSKHKGSSRNVYTKSRDYIYSSDLHSAWYQQVHAHTAPCNLNTTTNVHDIWHLQDLLVTMRISLKLDIGKNKGQTLLCA